MAYNREWDRGKDNWGDSSWNEGGAWNDNSGRGNVRGRDDDYYNDSKRRKYNNGGYDNQGYDDNGYESYNQGGHGREDQAEAYRGGGHNKKRQVPSEPSSHVIFLGLDPDFTEADLQSFLKGHKCSIETVTIIRDRSTGVSKGFGFAQFTSIEHARAFVDPLFPFVQVPPPASHGASATAAFNKALETGGQHNGRRVKIDYSQSANPTDRRGRGPLNTNDGTRDIGNTQAPVLLFRGLDPLSGPQAIHQAMRNSSGPGKEGAKGMKRIVLIKDKVTMASWGFAFVEFVDVQSAAAVLAATMTPNIHPSGFRISDKPVAASFAHPYSFQPLPDYSLRDDASIMSSTSLGGMEGAWVRYWDEGSTVATLEFKVEEPVNQTPATAAGKEKEKKKKVKSSDMSDKPAEASTLPVSDKPVTLNFKGGLGAKPGLTNTAAVGLAKKPATATAPTALGFSMADEDVEEDDQADADKSAVQDSKVAAQNKVAPMIASKKIANNITKWNQVQEELKDDSNTLVAAPAATTVITPPLADVKTNDKPLAPVPVEKEFEFSDTAALTCLLCARQFKSLDQLSRHNKESGLHKKNFKDPNLRDVAREKVKAVRAKSESAEQPKYRDRASERRIMHNQPDMPLPESSITAKKRQAEGPPPPPSPPPPPLNPGEDKDNVGNKLLRMMGWKEGTGLGTDGEGRVEPIKTAIYAQGVGLGASKGKEVGKYADGYSGYVHMAQDAARDRYNQ